MILGARLVAVLVFCGGVSACVREGFDVPAAGNDRSLLDGPAQEAPTPDAPRPDAPKPDAPKLDGPRADGGGSADHPHPKPDGAPGSEWTTVAQGFTTANLLGVSGSHSAVGAQVVIVGSGCTVLKIDGSGPTMIPPPSCTNETLNAVWSAGPDDFFVAGDGGNLYHRDSSAWARFPTSGASALRAIGGSLSANGMAVLAVGDCSTGWLYSGGQWKSRVLPVCGSLLGVRGVSLPLVSTYEWTVTGTSGYTGVAYENHAAGADGQWMRPFLFTGPTLRAIWGPLSSLEPVAAVGDSGTVAVRQNGQWGYATVQSWTLPSPTLTGVWGTVSPTLIQLFVVGYDSAPNGMGSAFRLTGLLATPLTLSAQEMSLPPGTGHLYAVWGYDDANQTNVYAVGDNGTILKHTSVAP